MNLISEEKTSSWDQSPRGSNGTYPTFSSRNTTYTDGVLSYLNLINSTQVSLNIGRPIAMEKVDRNTNIPWIRVCEAEVVSPQTDEVLEKVVKIFDKDLIDRDDLLEKPIMEARIHQDLRERFGEEASKYIIIMDSFLCDDPLCSIRSEPEVIFHPSESNDHRYHYFQVFPKGKSDLLGFILDTPSSRLEESLARKIFKEIMESLHFLHQAGYYHCDVSLENVVFHEGRWKLIDLGMAEPCGSYGSMLENTRDRGKEKYQSPEMANMQPFDHTSDYWGAAIILYAMITGEFLFQQSSKNSQQYTAVMNGDLRGWIETCGCWDVKVGNEEEEQQRAAGLPRISIGVIELIQDMLRQYPVDRLSYEDIIHHPWVGR